MFTARLFAALIVSFLMLSVASAQPVASKNLDVIVKFRVQRDSPVLSKLSQDVALLHGVTLEYVRPIATGGSVFSLRGKYLSSSELSGLVADLSVDPEIEYAEVDQIMHPTITPNDTLLSSQWALIDATGGINVQPAWNYGSGSNVVVAVLDTGYRPHADLISNILPGYDFISSLTTANDGDGRDADASDPGDWNAAGQCGTGTMAHNSSWHGTHVSGILAAVTNNSLGVAGVAYGSKVVPVRVLGVCGGTVSDIADALVWASGGSVSGIPSNANPAKVISMSIGGQGTCSSTYQAGINSALSRNVTVVVGAGNDSVDVSTEQPSGCQGVVVVAATAHGGGRSTYSNYGAGVTLAAPGGELNDGVVSTLNDGTTTPGNDIYQTYAGTSMATPHVSGVVALLYSQKPSITPNVVLSTLKLSARPFPATCTQCGSGILDANAAVVAIRQTPDQFVFTDLGNVSDGQTYTSNTITISGLIDSTIVKVSGKGAYSKNGGAFTTAQGTAVNGDTFKVSHTTTANASGGIVDNTTLSIGHTSDTFTTTERTYCTHC